MTAHPSSLDLSLYVHLPWCIKKCPYCDFNSHPLNNELPEADYLNALIADWKMQLDSISGRKIGTVFFGGGTPSLFSPNSFAKLLNQFQAHLTSNAEITMEANPGTLEYGDLKSYRDAGINRLSMGVQSFADSSLNLLGRIHSQGEARRAIDAAKSGGFSNINIDLMHGLPEQTVDAALHDLKTAIDAEVTHVSWYQLTIEPRTEFAKRTPRLPDENTLGDIEVNGLTLLRDAGFERYEISAYAAPAKQAMHNRNYWQFGDYLGLGAGAHGKLTHRADDDTLVIQRTAHPRQPRLYQQQANTGEWQMESTPVATAELPSEFMMNVLRLIDGVAESSFEHTTGLSLSTLEPQLGKWRQMGIMHPQRLSLTPMGINALDTVVADFLSD